jgi:hypothetical protein
MKHFGYCILLSGLSLTAAPAAAQQLGLSDADTPEQRLAEDLGAGFQTVTKPLLTVLPNTQNMSDVVQLGFRNQATTIQNNPGMEANQAYILQVGSLNTSAVTQNGSGNVTHVTQKGRSNNVVSEVTGNNNVTTLTQQGDDNHIVRQVATENAEFTLLQTGNNNRLNQLGNESQAPQRYSVEMKGNGIKLSIEQTYLK